MWMQICDNMVLRKVVVYIDLGNEGQKEMQLQLNNMLLHQNEWLMSNMFY
jgi:hypothetical protein